MDITPIAPTRRQPAPAAADPKLAEAAKQFEAFFLEKLTQGAREATVDDDPLIGGSNADGIWKDMLHSRLGEQAAGSVGIAELVMRHIRSGDVR
jgi:Rod binding domain-containing protein